MRVLLAGATGFIGAHLYRTLQNQGHHVRLIVRDAQRAHRRWPDADVVQADFAALVRTQDWLPLLDGTDAVINAVGIIAASDAVFDAVHVRAPSALFEAAEQNGVGRVIQISALGADENADSGFLRSKGAADRALAQRGLHACSVQPALVFGAHGASAQLFLRLARWPLLMLPDAGRQRVQPIHIDDVCDAIAALLQMPRMPARLELVGSRCLTLAEYLAILRAQLGYRPARVLRAPKVFVQCMARLGDRWRALPFDSARLRMLERGSCADATGTQRVLGRSPRAVEKFLGDDALAWRASARRTAAMRLLSLSVAAIWLITGAISFGLYPVESSLELLARCGLHGVFATFALYAAATLDIGFGIATLLCKRSRWLFDAQIAVILGYSAIIAVCLPEFLLHPFAPIVKNLVALAAIWLLRQEARDA